MLPRVEHVPDDLCQDLEVEAFLSKQIGDRTTLWELNCWVFAAASYITERVSPGVNLRSGRSLLPQRIRRIRAGICKLRGQITRLSNMICQRRSGRALIRRQKAAMTQLSKELGLDSLHVSFLDETKERKKQQLRVRLRRLERVTRQEKQCQVREVYDLVGPEALEHADLEAVEASSGSLPTPEEVRRFWEGILEVREVTGETEILSQ